MLETILTDLKTKNKMKIFIKPIIYAFIFSIILYLSQDFTIIKSMSIGTCLGAFMGILNDILEAIKSK